MFGEIDINFIDAHVLDDGTQMGHGLLEAGRILAVGLEIGWQQDTIGRQPGGLHDAHGGKHAERARRIGGGGDDAAPHVVAHARKLPRAILLQHGLLQPAAADDDGFAAQFRILQQFDGGKEGIHVQVGNPAAGFRQGRRQMWSRTPRGRMQMNTVIIYSIAGNPHGCKLKRMSTAVAFLNGKITILT